jgi:hypothetical protein
VDGSEEDFMCSVRCVVRIPENAPAEAQHSREIRLIKVGQPPALFLAQARGLVSNTPAKPNGSFTVGNRSL